MKVDFIMTPGSEARTFSLSSRILSSNLIDNDKLDVNFNMLGATSYFKAMISTIGSIKNRVMWSPFVLSKSVELFKEGVIDTIKSDTVLYSSHIGDLDFIIIDHLLKNGIKVVVGGSMTHFSTGKELRETLQNFHNTSDNLLKNIIFVKGYVDKKTDLYKIIKNWHDITLPPPDAKNIWECDQDYVKRYITILEKLIEPYRKYKINMNRYSENWEDSGSAIIIFRIGCWWRKCAYCFYPQIKSVDTLDNLDPNYVAEKILDMTDYYGTNKISIYDDYFIFNKKREVILKRLKEEKIKICIYTGITLLANKRYAEKVGKYCDGIKIGMESANDFTLDKIKRGHTRKDIIDAFSNIKNVFKNKKETYMQANIIINLPTRSETELKENYDFLNKLKRDMMSEGFNRFFFRAKFLRISESTKDNLLDGKYMIESNKTSKKTSTILFDRFSENGNLILPDFKLFEKELYSLFRKRF